MVWTNGSRNKLNWELVISVSVGESIVVIDSDHETFGFLEELPWWLYVTAGPSGICINCDLEPIMRPQCVSRLHMGLGL